MPGVFQIRFDKNINISGEAGGAMEGKGIPSDNKIINPVSVEQREQFFEVWLNFHNIVF